MYIQGPCSFEFAPVVGHANDVFSLVTLAVISRRQSGNKTPALEKEYMRPNEQANVYEF